MAYNQPEEYIFLSTQTASASASLSFTSLITSQYPVYYVKIRNLLPATNNTNLLVTFSTDNGSTYLSTNYQWSKTLIDQLNLNNNRSNADSSINIASAVKNTASKIANGEMYLYGFGQSVVPIISSQMVFIDNSTVAVFYECVGANSGTTAINAIKFAMSSGNITSGTISLYGMTI